MKPKPGKPKCSKQTRCHFVYYEAEAEVPETKPKPEAEAGCFEKGLHVRTHVASLAISLCIAHPMIVRVIFKKLITP